MASLTIASHSFASQAQTQAQTQAQETHKHSTPVLTHGIASGDITSNSAVIWARASAEAWISVEYARDPAFAQPQSAAPSQTHAATDYTASVKLNGLSSDTLYHYRVWASDKKDQPRPDESKLVVGSFRTAPAATTRRAVSFVFGGDVGGQGFCRQADQGYAIFEKMLALQPDFFVANGDMIYADNACPAKRSLEPGEKEWHNVPGDFPPITAPSVDWENLDQLRDVFWHHWRYNRADHAFQRFLQDRSHIRAVGRS